MWYSWEGGIYDPNGVALFDYSQDRYLSVKAFQKARINSALTKLNDNSQALIDYIFQIDYFSSTEKNEILRELYLYGQSATLENLLLEN